MLCAYCAAREVIQLLFLDSSSKVQEYAYRPRLDKCLAVSTHL